MTLHAVAHAALTLAIRLTLLLGATYLAYRLRGPRMSASTRHLLWTVAVAGALLLPVLSVALPVLRVPIATRYVAVSDEPQSSIAPSTHGLEPSNHGTASVDDTPPVGARTLRPSVGMIFLALYVMGVLLCLLRLAGAHVQVWRMLRRSAPSLDEMWVPASVRVRISSEPIPPLTIGIARPTIVLPRNVGDWSDERRRVVLLHEMAHIERRDCFTQLLAAIACALYWPHPLIWLGADCMRIEREHACDDAVLAAGVGAPNYATQLLEIARDLVPRRLPMIAVSMAAPRQLEQRLRAIIADERPRAAVSFRHIVAAFVVLLAVVTPLATLTASERVAAIPRKLSSRHETPVDSAQAPPAITPTTVAPKAPASPKTQPVIAGQFNIWLNADKSSAGDTIAHLTLFIPGPAGIIGSDYHLSRFEGLSTRQLRDAGGRLRFQLKAGAGTIAFMGEMQGHDGNGTFEFRADTAYAGRHSQNMSETRALEQLARTLATARIDAAVVHDARAVDSSLVRPDTQHVRQEHPSPLDGTWRASPARNGVRLDVEWSDINQWNRLVDPAELTPVSGGYMYHADAGEITFTGEIKDRRGSGTMLFSPNRSFADTLARLGIPGGGTLTTHDLKNFTFYGMNASTIRELESIGVGPITKDNLLGMAIFGVTPAFARALRSAGETDLSPENITSIKQGGRRR
jgi:beta-lactamase regulating signal transducer with metallopeptidase domain